MFFLKISKIYKRNHFEVLLYESSEREPGWRFTARCHTEPLVDWLDLAPANIREFRHRVCVSDKVLYYELLVCSINYEDIVLKFHFVWISAPELDQTLIIICSVCFPKCWKMIKIFENFEKFKKIDLHQKITHWMFSDEYLVREDCKTLVLLYEFPAETRLTVYRRLDIRSDLNYQPGREFSKMLRK